MCIEEFLQSRCSAEACSGCQKLSGFLNRLFKCGILFLSLLYQCSNFTLQSSNSRDCSLMP